jgi:hypothetical protein
MTIPSSSATPSAKRKSYTVALWLRRSPRYLTSQAVTTMQAKTRSKMECSGAEARPEALAQMAARRQTPARPTGDAIALSSSVNVQPRSTPPIEAAFLPKAIAPESLACWSPG